MAPGDRVAQLYPQALGTHFSRLLRHAWVTVGLSFNAGHHMGEICNMPVTNLPFDTLIFNSIAYIVYRKVNL
jgi:hypothetical protein